MRPCRARSFQVAAAAVVWIVVEGCTAFVRVGAGPSLEPSGGAGAVVGLTVGAAFGSTGSEFTPATRYDQSFAVSRGEGAPRSVLVIGARAYGPLGPGRFGVAGGLGLAFGRTPSEYRGAVGVALDLGPTLRLAGKNGRVVMGSCGFNNYGDRWGLYLFADFRFDHVRGDAREASRVSFPIGFEVRINTLPSSSPPCAEGECFMPSDDGDQAEDETGDGAGPDDAAPSRSLPPPS